MQFLVVHTEIVMDATVIGIHQNLKLINLKQLQSKSRFIKQTSAGQIESSTHIKLR